MRQIPNLGSCSVASNIAFHCFPNVNWEPRRGRRVRNTRREEGQGIWKGAYHVGPPSAFQLLGFEGSKQGTACQSIPKGAASKSQSAAAQVPATFTSFALPRRFCEDAAPMQGCVNATGGGTLQVEGQPTEGEWPPARNCPWYWTCCPCPCHRARKFKQKRPVQVMLLHQELGNVTTQHLSQKRGGLCPRDGTLSVGHPQAQPS